ncbi:cytochrome P450 [bacterium]|nr:cytochrome P450 [bacterium]
MHPAIPGPRGWAAVSTILRLRRDPLATLIDLTHRYGDVVAYRYGPLSRVMVNHPEGVVRILQDNHLNYNKNSPFYHMLKWFLGEGLITSDGELWRQQRRLIQPAFQRRKIEAMAPMMVASTEALIEGWRGRERVDVVEEMVHLTLRIIGMAIFSQDLSHKSHAVGQVMEQLQRQMQRRFQSFFPLPPVFPTARDRHFRAIKVNVRLLIDHLVGERRRQSNPPEDLLQALLEARDPDTAQPMSDLQLCDELVTLLMAGHETVANTLVWSLFLLSRHPDVRRRLEAEEEGIADRVVLEALRLYPPVGVYGRRSLGPDVLCGYPIGAGQIVSIAPYVLHRHPEFWPNPEGFDPDRFLQERPRGSFAPFAAGPRQCIGNHMAILEARLVLTALARQVRLNLVPGAHVVPDPQITLRPRGAVWMDLEFF